ncbi:non-ribosomal peptide synthetase [Aporhodopirellula aestuarii]|uniref:Amino acid adenylation domain-containing protein n=1 Tax=Aporhodopirellula aestuarii TaxID=2950107 RepID=A0ABT0U477_9BACT|nr:non-ribosomal peptide synthetase [Aporhodopirellula aestuarii]MCM2371156.1 amino acid adenylation domain-containing protein [Aporhodopirellula aestuarii]
MSDIEKRLASLSPAKRALLERMLLERAEARGSNITPRPADSDDSLSNAERRLWFVDQIAKDDPFYNMPLAARLRGPLDRRSLDVAIDQLIQRHESLRTTYHLVDGEPRRRVHESMPIQCTWIDVAASRNLDSDLRRRMRVASRAPFDLENGPLLQITVYRINDNEHVILLVMHHIISDGWSMIVMLRELTLAYEMSRSQGRELNGDTHALPQLPIQYADFAYWQNEQMSDQRIESQMEYWRRSLEDAPAVLDLPTDRPRPAIQDFIGATVELELPTDLTAAINQLAAKLRTTPFAVLMAAEAVLLGRFSRQRDFVLGTASAGRVHPEIEPLIGFFVNTLALRVRLEADLSFEDLVRQVHQTTVEAHEHADVPFERLVEDLAPTRDRSFSPIFQSALVMQNLPRDISEKGSIQVDPILVDNGTAKYDLTFFLWEESQRLIGHVEYRSTLFNRDTIERLIDSYRTFLIAATKSPESSIDRLPILSDQQRTQVVDVFNQTETANPPPYLLHELVEEQAAKNPNKIAVVHGDCEVSFQELLHRARDIAAHLIAAGVRRESAVVIKLPRSVDLIATVLGVLKAGGSFVPVDPELPTARIDRIVADTGANTVIDSNWIEGLSETPPRVAFPAIDPSDRAYVIFTSGSTGVAKGVEIEHRGIVNFVRAQIDRMQVQSDDRFSFSFSPSFDGAISEIFYSLSCGGTCVVVDKPTLLVPDELTRLLNEHRVTVGKFPPALLSTLDPSQLPNLRTVASAGDKLTGELARRWITGGRRLFNGYGPTEVSVGCSMMLLDDKWTGEKPPIGAPMNNMRMYVLDEHREPLPIGATGEIYIGGRGVGRGYLGQPEQTDAVFVEDPFVANGRIDSTAQDSSPRMYRTGDLGRWLANGVVEFIGRVDDQVSLRGFRIEPGEIAATLETLDGVRQATVIERTENNTSQLVAYVVPQTGELQSTQSTQLESAHVSQWRNLFEQTHRHAPPVLDPSFNITGWISTYTGKPIPAEEMRQWTEGAVRRILNLNPERVLEIGCGTGLLLLRIAEHCQAYVGSDLLESSLQNIHSELRRRPELKDTVTLVQADADQFEHLGDDVFDCVVLNSVVQYFPGVDYLLRVLEGAIDHITPGGSIFIGDVRNLRLQRAMATSIELANANGDLSIAEIKHRIAARLEHEEELLLDPSLFKRLQEVHPRISGIRVLLKDTAEKNELGRFRYDVVLTVDGPQIDTNPSEIEFTTLSDLNEAEKPPIAYTGIPNSRVAMDVHAADLLESLADSDTVADLQGKLACIESSLTLIEPNDVLAKISKPAIATWNEHDPSRFDIVLGDADTADSPVSTPAKSAPTAPSKPVDFTTLANDPIGTERSRDFTKTLRDELISRLPAYMIPSAFVVLDELPRTINGKIDRAKLPRPAGRPAWAGNFEAPTTPTQETLVKVWEDLIETRPIGIRDDFFELGGHSMLAVRMTSEIERRLGKRLPLVALFQNATIEHLATLIDQGELATMGSTLVPLKTVERSKDSSESLPPLFCIHPAGGTVFCYMEMAAHLQAGRAVYGIQANGVDGTQPPHETLAEMAAHYARAIREIHPEGTVHLAGWSLGGNIAFEVARQLESRGTRVGILALLDSGLMSPDTELREEDFLPLLSALFPGAMNLDLEEIRQKSPAEQLQFFVDRAAQAGIVPDELNDIVATKDTPNAAHVFGVFQANVKAVHEYVAEPFAGEVHLFRPADQGKTNSLFDDPVLGWREVTQDVHILEVPGDHAHMLQSPAAESIAQQLDELMQSKVAVTA